MVRINIISALVRVSLIFYDPTFCQVFVMFCFTKSRNGVVVDVQWNICSLLELIFFLIGPIICKSARASGPIICKSARASGPIICKSARASGPIICKSARASGPIICKSARASGPIICKSARARNR